MRAKTKPHVNLSRDYQIVCAGEVAASFAEKSDAENALRTAFAGRIGAYIAYPIGALNRDHLVAARRKAARDSAADTREIHAFLSRERERERARFAPKPPRVRESIEPHGFIMPQKKARD